MTCNLLRLDQELVKLVLIISLELYRSMRKKTSDRGEWNKKTSCADAKTILKNEKTEKSILNASI